MADMIPFSDIIGYWLGIFLTLAVLSFLYKDNPFYKLTEHLFIGISIGYTIMQQYYNVFEPKLVDRLTSAPWMAIIPLILCAMLFVKSVSQRWSWVGRFPLAFVVAFYAALEVNGQVQANLGAQVDRSVESLDRQKVNINTAPEEALTELPGIAPAVAKAVVERRAEQPFGSIDEVAALPGLTPAQRASIAEERGSLIGLDARAGTTPHARNWFKIFSEVLLLLGLLASLVYFYFSIEQKGAVGKVSRFGVWILMIGFGASFGYTVQGRLALAIGRAVDIMGKDKDPELAARIHGPVVAGISIVIIIAGIVAWELWLRKKQREGTGGDGGGGGAATA